MREPHLRPALIPTGNSPDAEDRVMERETELRMYLEPREAGQIYALLGLTDADEGFPAYRRLSEWLELHHPDERHRWRLEAEVTEDGEVIEMWLVDVYQQRKAS